MMDICLTVFVKNKGGRLRECLQSFLPYIDCFCICITSITNDISKIIKEETESYVGCLFEYPVDGSHNRNKVLKEAEENFPNCYYVMIDDSFILDGGYQFRNMVKNGTKSAYAVLIQNEVTAYHSIQIIKKGLRYKYRVHETIVHEDETIILEGFRFINHHVVRPKEVLEHDLPLLYLDHKDYPNDPSLLFLIGKTLYDKGDIEESGEWFKRRIIANRKKTFSEECYQSMMYICLIATHRKIDQKELSVMYLGIHKKYPSYAEPLYYASKCLSAQGKHSDAILVLEMASIIPFQPRLSTNFKIYREDIPKELCTYYFNSDTEKCVLWIYTKYTKPNRPFDFLYESYLRYLHRIQPRMPFANLILSYRDTLSAERLEELLSHTILSFSEEELQSYKDIITNYSIQHVLVLNRVDRIPFFPNIKNIHLLVQSDRPEGTLRNFPSLCSIIARDALHSVQLKQFLPSFAELVCTLAEWKNTYLS